MDMNFHKTEGTSTIGGKGRNGRHTLTMVEPSELGRNCSTVGAHHRCRYLSREPGREDDRKAARNWCEHTAEFVELDQKRPVRTGECVDDFGCAGE